MTSTEGSLSIAEVALRFGVSTGTVYNMIKAKRLIAFRPSGAPRGHLRVLDAECERHEIAIHQCQTLDAPQATVAA